MPVAAAVVVGSPGGRPHPTTGGRVVALEHRPLCHLAVGAAHCGETESRGIKGMNPVPPAEKRQIKVMGTMREPHLILLVLRRSTHCTRLSMYEVAENPKHRD